MRMKKTTDFQRQLLDLKLKLIEVQTDIAAAPAQPIEDLMVSRGFVPQRYKGVGQRGDEIFWRSR
jgi:hypothetical protein